MSAIAVNEQRHECKPMHEYMNEPFRMSVEIGESQLWVHDLFTPSTPNEYQREHETCYSVDIKFCPFCGNKV